MVFRRGRWQWRKLGGRRSCSWRRGLEAIGRLRLAIDIRLTRAREEDETLAWDVLIADSMTVARPLWRGEAGIFILRNRFIGKWLS